MFPIKLLFRALFIFLILISSIVLVIYNFSRHENLDSRIWNEKEVQILKTLSIDNVVSLKNDPSNRIENIELAAEFGQHLFFDKRLSSNGAVSCATCHQPDRYFTDGLPLAKGVSTGNRNTMTIVGAAFSPWQFWDGRKDSVWSQALEPLENPLEHAISRLNVVRLVIEDNDYRELYTKLFGEIPESLHRITKITKENENSINKVYVNAGKVIAAYERKLVPGRSIVDNYIEGIQQNDQLKINSLDSDEINGLKLFIGKAQCINCHNGPLFTNNEFHNNGVPSIPNQPASYGRATAVWLAVADKFNCFGDYSDADKDECQELTYTKKSGHELIGAHKVPSLRSVALTAPYMHAGQFQTLEQVIEHYNVAPNAAVGENELKPLSLTQKEKNYLISFLYSLTSPINAEKKWLEQPAKFSH